MPNLLIEYAMRNTHVPVGPWRGVNTNQNAVYLECFMDEVARAAGRDPLEFRRALMKERPKHLAVLNAVADKAGWGKPLPAGVHRGIAQFMGYGSYSAAVAEVSVSDRGKVKVHRLVLGVNSGHVVNPAQVEAQVEGSVAYGLGAALYQEITIKDGRVGGDQLRQLRDDAARRIPQGRDRDRAIGRLLGRHRRAHHLRGLARRHERDLRRHRPAGAHAAAEEREAAEGVRPATAASSGSAHVRNAWLGVAERPIGDATLGVLGRNTILLVGRAPISSMIPLLDGLRILDLTSVILGPYATQILGDFGAEIIKVEPPEGDSMRPVAPVMAGKVSAIFANNNRNKRSVVLDLKTEAGRAALMKLVPTADAFVHNMRQQALDKLGFTYKAVRDANPNIVYAAAVGFGRHGRYAGKPAYDDVIQAASGFAGLFQMRDGAPLYAPTIAADKISGLHLAHAVLAAGCVRERSGKRQATSRCRCSS